MPHIKVNNQDSQMIFADTEQEAIETALCISHGNVELCFYHDPKDREPYKVVPVRD
jgi:hypothetical protein